MFLWETAWRSKNGQDSSGPRVYSIIAQNLVILLILSPYELSKYYTEQELPRRHYLISQELY